MRILSILCFVFLLSCKKGTGSGDTQPAPQPLQPTAVKLQADGPGNTYELISAVLGGNPVEAPDCAHPAFGRHIYELFDNSLNKNVFVFSIHVSPDNDRCNGSTDRQRNEIKTYGPSPDKLKGQLGDTVTYRWKFRLDEGFRPSPSFTHIHQIKAGDGNDDMPTITITPRHGNPERLEVIHNGNSMATTLGRVKSVELAPFKGVWVEVVEKLVYGTAGSIDIRISRLSDGAELLVYTNGNIDLWRDGTSFCRPKWGIYRSLNDVSYLRDEEVRFADFCIAEGKAVCSQ
ncbi:MAG TPA: heparin lyase I family protein [Flavisolibacter sp.]|nr:heparin lyase I family protein [Flavisolibacter sp.]